MDSGHQPADECCSTTARALDIFNRRGSLLAVALGGYFFLVFLSFLKINLLYLLPPLPSLPSPKLIRRVN
ncbi:unnamed protein product [Gongylonema pulchrum]|uniref:Uncharacterized protein n=1 Tax=Gongylonema pulchrum TaxID=637853 RepID=A0A183E0U0_9BILA|nr:unnamed protein product [Gongylonema pulchrum]